eukprot:SAG31_NODE_2617_length_5370_cov_10.481503_1_plen_166_part_00
MASYGVGTPYVPYDSASVTKAKGPRAPLYQKTDQQIKILNQWWKTKTRTGNIDKTLVDIGEKQRLASKTGAQTHPPSGANATDALRGGGALNLDRGCAAGLPLKVLENWLGNSRKKARKIAREGGALPTQPITKRGKAKKPKPKPKPKPKAKGKGKVRTVTFSFL